MKNFSEIDTELLEGMLDSTSSKVKDVKKLSKEMVERNKVIEKIGQLSWLINDFNYYLRHTQKDTTAGSDCRDLVGNPIKFGDFVMYSQLDDWNEIKFLVIQEINSDNIEKKNAQIRHDTNRNEYKVIEEESNGKSIIDAGSYTNLELVINGGINKNVKWSVSDPKVLTIYKGIVLGLQEGNAKVTATSVLDESVYGELVITVNKSNNNSYSQDEIDYVNSIKYNSAEMKCTKSDFVKYISWWLEDLIDSNTEDDIAYHKEFYLPQIYKKKYLPFRGI